MKKITLALLLLFTITTIAQSNSINYKALIKDANNAVIANTPVIVQFQILQGVAQTNVYQETHTPTTDANGIIIINIGDGVVNSGVYANIDWSSDDHFLNTQINSGSGLTDMGTTGFNAVPYALSAKTAENIFSGDYNDLTNTPVNFNTTSISGIESASNVASGLYATAMGLATTASGARSTALGQSTEASAGASTAMGFLTIASGAQSTAMGRSTDASGAKSTAMGWSTDASGAQSTAMGQNTEATGTNSTAMGLNTEATGYASTAMGLTTTASGAQSTAMGITSIAESFGQTTLGTYNVPTTPFSATGFIALDRLLVVGNGVSGATSDALVILKNGTITAPSFDISEITDAKALVTKEYADANYIDASFSGDYNDLSNQPVLFTSADETDPKVATTFNNVLPKWNGTNLINSSIYQVAGRVGINTNSPDALFNVVGGDVELGSPNSGIIMVGDVGSNITIDGNEIMARNNTSAAPLNLQAQGGSLTVHTSVPGTQMVIQDNGDVGIGSSSPSQKLDVDGQIRMRSGATNGYVPVSSADGTMTWTDPASFTSEAPTGLEAVNEGNGNGLVKVGRVAANYGNVGLDAVDLSFATFANTTRGATGDYSTAMGSNTTASGILSTAMGASTIASGKDSTAFGDTTTASGESSTAFGDNSTASGDYTTAFGRDSQALGEYSTAMGRLAIASGRFSTAMGWDSTAESYAQTTLGTFNVRRTPNNANAFNTLDPILVVGNGININAKSDALVILKNGTITAPSFGISEITDAKALVTKEFADANYIDAVFSGNYNDLSNVPVLFNGDYNNLTNQPTLFSESYNDLTDLPVLFTTADETDPKVTSTTTNTVPKWDGTSLVDGSISDVDGDIGIGTISPDPSAQLDVNSTTKGFLPPRMSEVERNSIAAPVAAGLIVWCTNCGDNGEVQVYNGTEWTNIIGGTASAAPALGDFYKGGYIFYLDASGEHGLIAATADLPASSWGCRGTLVGTTDDIGNGQTNTTAIVNNACHMADGITLAGEACDTYDDGTYSDWFLPSRFELELMWANLADSDQNGTNTGPGDSGNIGSFQTNSYWSSTENGSNNTFIRGFGSGNENNWNKNSSWNVRPVRAF